MARLWARLWSPGTQGAGVGTRLGAVGVTSHTQGAEHVAQARLPFEGEN